MSTAIKRHVKKVILYLPTTRREVVPCSHGRVVIQSAGRGRSSACGQPCSVKPAVETYPYCHFPSCFSALRKALGELLLLSAFCCCGKATWGGRGLFGLQVTGITLGKLAEAGTQGRKRSRDRLASPGLLSCFSSTAQLPRDDIAHRSLGPCHINQQSRKCFSDLSTG